MIFERPTKRIERKAGFSESYHLDTDGASFYVNTLVGGWDAFKPAKEEKLVYILKGLGKVTLGDKEEEYAVESGEQVEIPKRTSHELKGQLQYILTDGMGEFQITTNSGDKDFGTSEKSRFFYVLDGLASATLDGRKNVAKEGYLVEVPAGTEFTLSGNITYVYATSI